MKTLLICLCFLSFMAHSQSISNSLSAYGVYVSASDYAAHDLTDGFSIKDNTHKLRDEVTHHVYIDNNGSSHRYSYDSIWGFRKEGKDWRIFNYRIYNLVYSGKAFVYVRPTKTDFSQPGLTRFETTFFSATPDSPVYLLTQENLSLVFAGNPSFVKKLTSLPASYNVAKKDKATGQYQFISWL